MPKGKYYEYQIKRSALDEDYLSGNIDDFQYARESLDLDLGIRTIHTSSNY